MVFEASNNASIGVYGHNDSYLFAGNNIKITFHIEDAEYKLSAAIIDSVKYSTESSSTNPITLAENAYSREIKADDHSYVITLNNVELMYIYSVSFSYAVSK